MTYPPDFPTESRNKVEAEKILAGREFEAEKQRIPWDQSGLASKLEELLVRYILRLFLVFAKEACALARNRVWTVDRVRKEANDSLLWLTHDAHYEKGYDRDGGRLRQMVSDSHLGWSSLLPEIERKFKQSDEWHQFEDELLAVIDALRPEASTKTKGEIAPTPPDPEPAIKTDSVDGEIPPPSLLSLSSSVANARSPQEQISRTLQSIPKRWDELSCKGSITQTEAANYLRCDPRTVRTYLGQRRLDKTQKRRVACNEKLRHELRRVHGNGVLQ